MSPACDSVRKLLRSTHVGRQECGLLFVYERLALAQYTILRRHFSPTGCGETERISPGVLNSAAYCYKGDVARVFLARRRARQTRHAPSVAPVRANMKRVSRPAERTDSLRSWIDFMIDVDFHVDVISSIFVQRR